MARRRRPRQQGIPRRVSPYRGVNQNRAQPGGLAAVQPLLEQFKQASGLASQAQPLGGGIGQRRTLPPGLAKPFPGQGNAYGRSRRIQGILSGEREPRRARAQVSQGPAPGSQVNPSSVLGSVLNAIPPAQVPTPNPGSVVQQALAPVLAQASPQVNNWANEQVGMNAQPGTTYDRSRTSGLTRQFQPPLVTQPGANVSRETGPVTQPPTGDVAREFQPPTQLTPLREAMVQQFSQLQPGASPEYPQFWENRGWTMDRQGNWAFNPEAIAYKQLFANTPRDVWQQRLLGDRSPGAGPQPGPPDTLPPADQGQGTPPFQAPPLGPPPSPGQPFDPNYYLNQARQFGQGAAQAYGLPLDPQYQANLKVLEDELAQQLSSIGVAWDQIPAITRLFTSRLATDRGRSEEQLRERLADRGVYSSGITGQDLAELANLYERQGQDFATQQAQQYQGLLGGAGEAYNRYQRGLMDLLLAIAQRNQFSSAAPVNNY